MNYGKIDNGNKVQEIRNYAKSFYQEILANYENYLLVDKENIKIDEELMMNMFVSYNNIRSY